MLAIEINGNFYYFNEWIEADTICMWININMFDFLLEEAHSCKCTVTGEKSLLIKGDEDTVEVEIFKIEPIL